MIVQSSSRRLFDFQSTSLSPFSSYFLEHGMLAYFLNYMGQKNGRSICVQILQTLNILFDNIRHETSLCKSS